MRSTSRQGVYVPPTFFWWSARTIGLTRASTFASGSAPRGGRPFATAIARSTYGFAFLANLGAFAVAGLVYPEAPTAWAAAFKSDSVTPARPLRRDWFAIAADIFAAKVDSADELRAASTLPVAATKLLSHF